MPVAGILFYIIHERIQEPLHQSIRHRELMPAHDFLRQGVVEFGIRLFFPVSSEILRRLLMKSSGDETLSFVTFFTSDSSKGGGSLFPPLSR